MDEDVGTPVFYSNGSFAGPIALVFLKEHTDQIAWMSCPGCLTLYVVFDPLSVVGTTVAAFTRRVTSMRYVVECKAFATQLWSKHITAL
jgi:hypothetical protein